MGITLQKSLSRGQAIEDVFKLLAFKGYNLEFGSTEELGAVKSFIQNSADAGDSIEQIAAKILAQADADTAVDTFTNTLSPGQYEAIIPAKNRPRTTGWHDQNAVPGKYRTTDKLPSQGNPSSVSDGFASDDDKLTAGESYGSTGVGGSGGDRQSTRTTTKPTRYGRGGQQPDHPPQGQGLSGNYGRSSIVESQATEEARTKSAQLRFPERYVSLIKGVKMPIVPVDPRATLVKGIGYTFTKSQHDEEEREDIASPDLQKLEEDDAHFARGEELDEVARKLEEEGKHEDAKTYRALAMRERGQIGKSSAVMKARKLFGYSP